MKYHETCLEGVIVIEPEVYLDERGYFQETFNTKNFKSIGIGENFVQDNLSRSKKNVLRGLHFQKNNPQGKLVRCGTGTVFDVVVDIDPSSKNFLKYFSIELSDQNLKMLWVPAGYAHGFCVLSDFADFHYKCTDYYDANDQHGLIWNDKNIGIEWPIIEPIVSEKDLNLPTVSSFFEI